MNINSVIKEELKGLLILEGISDILYHYTYISNLISILKLNKFATSSNLGSTADANRDKGKFFFFSTSRSKGMSGYGGRHGSNAVFVLDGRKLQQTFKGKPMDYWNWSTKSSDYKDKNSYRDALLSKELEDRIITDKPFIEPANIYIKEIHIKIYSEHTDKEEVQEIQTLAGQYNIPVYFYIDDQAYALQNKSKAIPADKLDVQDKLNKYESNRGNDTRDFLNIAPYILLKNNSIGIQDALKALLMNYLKTSKYDNGKDRTDQYQEFWNNVNEKVKKLSSSWGRMYDDDQYRSIAADIHNNRGNPNKNFRELLKLLVADMKKNNAKNLKTYMNIKTANQ